MLKMRLNSIDDDIFTAENVKNSSDIQFEDPKIDQMLADYRLLAVETVGRSLDAHRKANNLEGYSSRLDDKTFRKMSIETHKKFKEILLDIYCKEYNMRNNGSLVLDDTVMKDEKVTKMISKFLSIIVAPSYYSVMSDAYDLFVKVVTAERGKAAVVDIMSTEVIRFEDTATGSEMTTGLQHIYNGSMSILPQPKTANVEIKYRHLIENPNMIAQVYAALFKGLQAYVMGRFGKALKLLKENTDTNGATAVYDGIQNDLTAVEFVSTLNNVPVNRVARVGTRIALNKLVPNGTSIDAGLAMGLGEEWFKNGYIGTINRVPSIAITNAFTPGTQFTKDAKYVIDSDALYYIPMAGESIMYMAIEEGSPMTIEIDPRQTKDGTYVMNVTTRMALEIVLGRLTAVVTISG